MTFSFALILYSLFLVIYGFFVSAILWHIKEYTMAQDFSKWIIRAFLTIILFLGMLSLFLFFTLPFA